MLQSLSLTLGFVQERKKRISSQGSGRNGRSSEQDLLHPQARNRGTSSTPPMLTLTDTSRTSSGPKDTAPAFGNCPVSTESFPESHPQRKNSRCP